MLLKILLLNFVFVLMLVIFAIFFHLSSITYVMILLLQELRKLFLTFQTGVCRVLFDQLEEVLYLPSEVNLSEQDHPLHKVYMQFSYQAM